VCHIDEGPSRSRRAECSVLPRDDLHRPWAPKVPARGLEIPCSPSLGKSPGKTREGARIEGSRHAQKPGFAQFPRTFPVDQGFRPRDGFALACTHRHSVCGCGECPRALRHSLRDLRDSAGSWRSSPRCSEPETAGSGPGRRRCPCLSLSASRPVRFRRRFTSSRPKGFSIRFIYWYPPSDTWAFHAFGEKLNLEILRAFEAEGIQLVG
jgi:hypothetical protein